MNMKMKYLNVIISILGFVSTLLVLWQNFIHRQKPNISIEYWPAKDVRHSHSEIKLQNKGDNIRIIGIICCPNNFICGLPIKHHENWNSEEIKTYVLNSTYFPIKKSINIYIVVKDNHGYQFCICLSYLEKEMRIRWLMDYNIILKTYIYLKSKLYTNPQRCKRG